ncbi:MAG: PA14 domain-containing protein [Prolixibacteraceae bacterium]
MKYILFDPANQPPNTAIPPVPVSIRWSGLLNPTISGKYTFAIRKSGKYKLYLDDKMVMNTQNELAILDLEARKSYALKLEYNCISSQAYCALSWKTPDKKAAEMHQTEKKLAKNAMWRLQFWASINQLK